MYSLGSVQTDQDKDNLDIRWSVHRVIPGTMHFLKVLCHILLVKIMKLRVSVLILHAMGQRTVNITLDVGAE